MLSTHGKAIPVGAGFNLLDGMVITMTLPGETFSSGLVPEQGEIVSELQVCKSGAGYYIGTLCYDKELDAWLPYTRESVDYYRTEAEAKNALATGRWAPRG